jgi:hypothetical protein
LIAAIASGYVGGSCNEWGAEDAALFKEIVHPLTPGFVLHDSSDIGPAIALGDLEFFLALTDLLSV